jgi:hypothetical protein
MGLTGDNMVDDFQLREHAARQRRGLTIRRTLNSGSVIECRGAPKQQEMELCGDPELRESWAVTPFAQAWTWCAEPRSRLRTAGR